MEWSVVQADLSRLNLRPLCRGGEASGGHPDKNWDILYVTFENSSHTDDAAPNSQKANRNTHTHLAPVCLLLLLLL